VFVKKRNPYVNIFSGFSIIIIQIWKKNHVSRALCYELQPDHLLPKEIFFWTRRYPLRNTGSFIFDGMRNFTRMANLGL